MNFTVETSDVAEAEIDAAYFQLSRWNPEFAGRWLEGMYRILDTLSEFPTRHARVAESDVLGREVRVRVLRVRYGAQQSLGQPTEDDE